MTRRWPAGRDPLAMTAGERWWRRASLIAVFAGPAAAAWTGDAPRMSLLGVGLAGVVGFSATLSWWMARDERGWWRAIFVVPMLIGLAGGAVTVLVIFVLSGLVRAAVWK